MASQANADVRALYFEKVDPTLPRMFRTEGPLVAEIEKRKATVVSPRTMRVPIRMSPGGKYRAWNPDGGSLGLGSGQNFQEANLTPQNRLFAVQWTKQVQYATDSTNKALKNAVKDAIAEAMDSYRDCLDSELQTNGDGVLGVVSSNSGTTPWVVTMTGDYGTRLFREGVDYDVYDSGVTTNRGPVTCTAISADFTTVTFNTKPSGGTNTDLIVVSGMTAVGAIGSAPVGLFGLPYHQNDATSGLWLGLDRNTYNPKLSTPSVDAAGGALVTAYTRLARNKIRRRLGLDKAKNSRRALVNVEQSAAWEELALTVQRIDRTGAGGEKVPDMNMGEDLGNIAGYKPLTNIHFNPKRIDFVDFSQWGRAELYPIRFYTDQDGKKFFTITDPVTGAPTANEVFYIEHGPQFFVTNPQMGAYVKNLAVPTGY